MSEMDLISAIDTLSEYCECHECRRCCFNRGSQDGFFDCMLTNTSPAEWSASMIGGNEDEAD